MPQPLAAMQMKRHSIILFILFTFFNLSAQIDRFLEESVNNIFLTDSSSVLNMLGPDIRNRDINKDEVCITNNDSSQFLIMIFHPGDAKNEFREFKVVYNILQFIPDYKICTSFFITGKGIKLGLNKKKVKSILGKPNKTMKVKDSDLWVYEVKDNPYFGQYIFTEGKLIQYWFGESYQ